MRDRRTPIVVAVAAVLSIGACSDTRQQQVAGRGQEMMPFDLDTATHAFTPSADGGTQTVTSDDPDDIQQIDLHAWFDAQTSDHGDHARQD